jgi:hypothetical protein
MVGDTLTLPEKLRRQEIVDTFLMLGYPLEGGFFCAPHELKVVYVTV